MLRLMKDQKHGQRSPGGIKSRHFRVIADGIAIRIVAEKVYGTCWYQSGVLILGSPLCAGHLLFSLSSITAMP